MKENNSTNPKMFRFSCIIVSFIISFFSLTFNSYAESIIRLTYPQSCFLGLACGEIDLDLPGIPSLDREAYVDTLNNWALTAENPVQITKDDIELYIDQPTYQKNTLSGISFDVINEGEVEQFDFSNFDNYPLKGQMRDIVFLESMQNSILKWENDYITTLSTGDEFSDIFDRAVEIYEQYQFYTGEKGFLDVTTNPILNTLLGTGNTNYGTLFAADGTVEGFTEDLFVELSATAFLENNITAGLSSVEITLKDPTTWKDLGTQFTRDLVFDKLVDNKIISSTSSQTIRSMFDAAKAVTSGGTGLILAPAKLYYSTFSELMTTYNNASGGAYFTFYYYLMDKHADNSSNFFNADGSLKTWDQMSVVGQIDSICNDTVTYDIDASDNVAALLCQTANYTSGFGQGLITTNGQAEYATSLANLFLFIKNINIAELKTKVAQQVALEKESDLPAPPPDETITHNGLSYGTVTSPYTGRVWLDRNLGASRVANSSTDSEAYGDLYQWGRLTDGHETLSSGSTRVHATDINNAGANFVITAPMDWASVDSTGALRKTNWMKTDGSSVCPEGYRVPTQAELLAETRNATNPSVTNSISAYNSFLKWPEAGYKSSSNWPYSQGRSMTIWSSSPSGTLSGYVEYYESGGSHGYTNRISGHSVRCIKATITNQPPAANAGLDQTVTIGADVTLDASASSDSDGTIVSYQWQELNTLLSNDVSFTTANWTVGTHIITLTVTDNDGAVSIDTVVVTVNTTDNNQPEINLNNTSYTSPTTISADIATADDQNIIRASFAIYDSNKNKLNISSLISVTSPTSTFNSDPTALTWGYDPATLNTTTSWDIDISGLAADDYYIKFFASDGVNPAVETSYIGFTKATFLLITPSIDVAVFESGYSPNISATLASNLPDGYKVYANFGDSTSWIPQSSDGGHVLLSGSGNFFSTSTPIYTVGQRRMRVGIFNNEILVGSYSDAIPFTVNSPPINYPSTPSLNGPLPVVPPAVVFVEKNSVLDNSGSVVEDITNHGTVLEGTLSGTIINEGVLDSVTIAEGSTVTGGILAGEIINSGTIEGDIALEPQTIITGGILSGTLVVEPEGATVNNLILDVTSLDNVIIGAGIRFTSTTVENIPDLDLSGSVIDDGGIIDPTLPLFITEDWQELSMVDLIASASSLALADIDTAVSIIGGTDIVISSDSLGETIYPARVIGVASTNEPDSIYINATGEIVIVTGGIANILAPTPCDQVALENGLNEYGVRGEIFDDGVMLVTHPDGSRLSLRLDTVATINYTENFSSPNTLQTASHFGFEGDPEDFGNFTYIIYYPDGTMQRLPPSLHDLQLFSRALKDVRQDFTINPSSGIIELFDAEGTSIFRFVPSYKLEPATGEEQGVHFDLAGDVNGDGLQDYYMSTSAGRQLIYSLH